MAGSLTPLFMTHIVHRHKIGVAGERGVPKAPLSEPCFRPQHQREKPGS